MHTKFKVTINNIAPLLHPQKNKPMSVLSHPSPILPVMLLLVHILSQLSLRRIPNQNPGPQSLCNTGQQTLCRHRRPPKPQLSCYSPAGGCKDSFLHGSPLQFLLPHPPSHASPLSISSNAPFTCLPLLLLGVVSSSRCLPSTKTW